jgi:hypothetical protein
MIPCPIAFVLLGTSRFLPLSEKLFDCISKCISRLLPGELRSLRSILRKLLVSSCCFQRLPGIVSAFGFLEREAQVVPDMTAAQLMDSLDWPFSLPRELIACLEVDAHLSEVGDLSHLFRRKKRS